jgi:hypothetical protein
MRFIAYPLVARNLLPFFRTTLYNSFSSRAPSIKAICRFFPAPLIRACEELHQKH